jgi:hypothetical protein
LTKLAWLCAAVANSARGTRMWVVELHYTLETRMSWIGWARLASWFGKTKRGESSEHIGVIYMELESDNRCLMER